MGIWKLCDGISHSIPAEFSNTFAFLPVLISCISLAFLIFTCFFCYHLQRIWLPIYSAFLCHMLLLGNITFAIYSFGNAGGYIVIIGCFLLSIAVAYFVYKHLPSQAFIIAFTNFVCTYFALDLFIEPICPKILSIVICLISAIAASTLSHKFSFIQTIVTSSFASAVTAACIILKLFSKNSTVLFTIIAAVLAISGFIAQLLYEKARQKKEIEIEDTFDRR
ncbi:MAG: hypothetical protein RR573_06250 [Oscillospiraceae bacterium]